MFDAKLCVGKREHTGGVEKISKNLEKCLPSIYGDGWMAPLPIIVALSSTRETIFQTMLDFEILIRLQNQN